MPRPRPQHSPPREYPLPRGLTDDCRVPNDRGEINNECDFETRTYPLETMTKDPLVDICLALGVNMGKA
ncbi:hypothetical protein K523DRAFT_357498 [Schizophyllum commune Tattone D]|nr:hypothetical protein K523DRAFT_357498 [Schizophyllum commune Tattone D]